MAETYYAERMLYPLGFTVVERFKNRALSNPKLVLERGDITLSFVCSCPAQPSIKSLGCPLHCEEQFGGSAPVLEAVELYGNEGVMTA